MLNNYKINVSRYGHQEWNQVDKHDTSRQMGSLICVHKQPQDIHIICNDPFRVTSNRLAPDYSKVHAKYCVRMFFNVVICDGAVLRILRRTIPSKLRRDRVATIPMRRRAAMAPSTCLRDMHLVVINVCHLNVCIID